jgi:hypothetical protein
MLRGDRVGAGATRRACRSINRLRLPRRPAARGGSPYGAETARCVRITLRHAVSLRVTWCHAARLSVSPCRASQCLAVSRASVSRRVARLSVSPCRASQSLAVSRRVAPLRVSPCRSASRRLPPSLRVAPLRVAPRDTPLHVTSPRAPRRRCEVAHAGTRGATSTRGAMVPKGVSEMSGRNQGPVGADRWAFRWSRAIFVRADRIVISGMWR